MSNFKEETQQLLNKRNTASVEQSLKQVFELLSEQNLKIIGLQNTIATLNQKVIELENLTRIQKARLTGHGPSSV